jgi:hypothetical protein
MKKESSGGGGGYNWATLSLANINARTRSSRLGFGLKAVKAYRVVRSRVLHIIETAGSHAAVGLSALSTSRALLVKRFYVLVSVRGSVNPRAKMRLEISGKVKKKCNSFFGIRTLDLQACSIAPQPTTLPCAHQTPLI